MTDQREKIVQIAKSTNMGKYMVNNFVGPMTLQSYLARWTVCVHYQFDSLKRILEALTADSLKRPNSIKRNEEVLSSEIRLFSNHHDPAVRKHNKSGPPFLFHNENCKFKTELHHCERLKEEFHFTDAMAEFDPIWRLTVANLWEMHVEVAQLENRLVNVVCHNIPRLQHPNILSRLIKDMVLYRQNRKK